MGDFPARYMQFGKSATPEELRSVLQQLRDVSASRVRCARSASQAPHPAQTIHEEVSSLH